MLSVSGIRLPYQCSEGDVKKAAARVLRTDPEALRSFSIRKKSLDARKKPDLYYEYQIEASLDNEKKILRRTDSSRVRAADRPVYHFPEGKRSRSVRPVIIGAGPAGLFAAWYLAEQGYAPVILERGRAAGERTSAAERLFRNGILDPENNLQFGEGGAGTFSDGKLNTQIKDPDGRIRAVLEIFVSSGAPREILYEAKPHLGTDMLSVMLPRMRGTIEDNGGEFRFGCRADELLIRAGHVCGVRCADGTRIDTDSVILACGHSARDTYASLRAAGVPMVPKAFAAGLRIMHPQEMIDRAQYGRERDEFLPPASYKLTHSCKDGRGIYSFCMCPGGYVVNASSERNALAVNGMSYYARDGEDANAALIVTVRPQDYAMLSFAGDPLAGVIFQRQAEEAAYALLQGAIPLQTLRAYAEGLMCAGAGPVKPAVKGKYAYSSLTGVYPEFIRRSILEGTAAFDRKIPGFGRGDALLAGPETRTSSPVRIPRDASGQSDVRGLYPCGEGAGYAGGIISAAVDGIRTAEAYVLF